MNKKLFSAMTRRRVSCPQITQQLWDAIKIIKYQRQVPNVERIARYMSRVHGIKEDEVGRQLNHCVRDGLIKLIKKIGSKGSQAGVEQEGYGLPPGQVEKDDHDWYCSECHSGGDVICCTTCYRVYHLACISTEELPEEDVKNTFICTVCKKCDTKINEPKLKKRALNHLLRFACARMKDRLPVTLMDRQVPSSATYMSDRSSSGQCLSQHRSSMDSGWVTDQDDAWRSQFLIYRPMDLKMMEEKTEMNKYRLVEEFKADAQTIVHNVVIYHGVHSSLADMARQMLRDCIYDLQEMLQCADCYRYSNEKKGKHWFCQLCKTPHQLVYAKQKTFPFWPAKVIKITDDQYDVRFFGGQHQRAVVQKANIRPISVNIHTLKVKRTSAWNKACEELMHHQKLIEEAKKNANGLKAGESSADEEVHVPCDDNDIEKPDPNEPPKKKTRGRKRKKPIVEEPIKVAEATKAESDSVDETSSTSTSTVQPSDTIKMEGSSQEDNLVSSSSQEPRFRSVAVQTTSLPLPVPKTAASKAALEKVIQDAELEKQHAVATAVRELQDHLTKEHNLEIKQLKEKHRAELAETKKKPWCFNCGNEAIYHCCWNTAYCSIDCQQAHWHRDHKRVCRRKH